MNALEARVSADYGPCEVWQPMARAEIGATVRDYYAISGFDYVDVEQTSWPLAGWLVSVASHRVRVFIPTADCVAHWAKIGAES